MNMSNFSSTESPNIIINCSLMALSWHGPQKLVLLKWASHQSHMDLIDR